VDIHCHAYEEGGLFYRNVTKSKSNCASATLIVSRVLVPSGEVIIVVNGKVFGKFDLQGNRILREREEDERNS